MFIFYDTEVVPGTTTHVAVALTDSGDPDEDEGRKIVTGKAYARCICSKFLTFDGLGSILCEITICAFLELLADILGMIAVPVPRPRRVTFDDTDGFPMTGKKNIYPSVPSGRLYCI